MPAPSPDRIRSLAVVGHSHDGKTTLCEALIHVAGATARMGSTDQGTSVLDYEPEEQARSMSLGAAVAHCEWNGVSVNLVDCPGFQDFAGEVAQALAAVDGALLVVGASGSVPVGAELAWDMLRAAGLPAMIVINKMDKDNAAFEATVDALRDAFARKPVAVAIPIGSGDGFNGYVDLVSQKAYQLTGSGTTTEIDLPEVMRDEVKRAHTALVDSAAESDDKLLEKYLEGSPLNDDEVRNALHAATRSGKLVPVFCSASADARSAAGVLDAIVNYLPSPAERTVMGKDSSGTDIEIACDPDGPLCAQVFKTTIDPFGKVSYFRVLRGTMRADTHPYATRLGVEERFAQLGQPMGKTVESVTEVVAGDIGVVTKLGKVQTGDTLCTKDASVTLPALNLPALTYVAAITAASKGDEDKIMTALSRQSEEDPCFHVEHDAVTGEVIVSGLGDIHLAVALERMKRKFSVDASLHPPKIAYRETITGTARVQHRYKKQSGGAGLFGDCTIEIEPLPRGEGYEWQDKIFGGTIPQQFRPSVEKGVRQTLEKGAISGHPIVDVRVRLVDGSTHPVDGKDIAFQIAGSMAMREAVQQAHPVLLEPIMDVSVVVPDTLMGDAMSLLNGSRGKVGGMNPLGDGRSEVNALVPQAEMFSFPIGLRALSQGRGRYSMSFSHYEEMPPHVAQPLIEAFSKEHVGVGDR